MTKCEKAMRGYGCGPLDLALKNLEAALRASAMVTEKETGLVPSPLTIVIAEIKQAQRNIRLTKEKSHEAE